MNPVAPAPWRRWPSPSLPGPHAPGPPARAPEPGPTRWPAGLPARAPLAAAPPLRSSAPGGKVVRRVEAETEEKARISERLDGGRPPSGPRVRLRSRPSGRGRAPSSRECGLTAALCASAKALARSSKSRASGETVLLPPKGGFEVEQAPLRKEVGSSDLASACQRLPRLPESLVGAVEVVGDPPGVGEVGPGIALKPGAPGVHRPAPGGRRGGRVRPTPRPRRPGAPRRARSRRHSRSAKAQLRSSGMCSTSPRRLSRLSALSHSHCFPARLRAASIFLPLSSRRRSPRSSWATAQPAARRGALHRWRAPGREGHGRAVRLRCGRRKGRVGEERGGRRPPDGSQGGREEVQATRGSAACRPSRSGRSASSARLSGFGQLLLRPVPLERR